MSLSGRLLGAKRSTGNYAESHGHYERIPIRVGEFALKTNEEDKVVFETTSQEFCDDGPKITVIISNGDAGWSVGASQACYGWAITPSVDLHDDRLARRRAMWHAAQYMAGRDLSHRERFSLMHRSSDDADLFEDDAFFKNGNAVTNDPFGEFLEDK